jgi:hypothetical protein
MKKTNQHILAALAAALIGTAVLFAACEALTGPQGEPGRDGINGTNGADGAKGDKGDPGDSAYDIAVQNGFEGTEVAWVASLAGKSAYEIAKALDYSGTEAEWIASLKGAQGDTGQTGANGKSAYDVAVEDGFTGNETQWLATLVGADGTAGTNGKSAYEIAVALGYDGSREDWLASLKGAQGEPGKEGKSAYELWLEMPGNAGKTVEQFLDSLKAATLQSIAVTSPPTKAVYAAGEALDLTGLAVTGTYSNGTTKAETVDLSNISGYSANTVGQQTLTVTVDCKTATFAVTVKISGGFTVNLEDPINDIPANIVLSKSGTPAFVALEIAGTYAAYAWHLNDAATAVSTGAAYTLNAADCRLGTNYLTVEAKTTGGVYNAREITFTVNQ